VALPAGEVAVVRGDHRTLFRPRRERPLILVRFTVPFPPSEVRHGRAGLLTVLAPRVVGVKMMYTLLPMLRAVLIVLRSHCGLRFTSLFWTLPTSRSTSEAAAAPTGPTRPDDDRGS